MPRIFLSPSLQPYNEYYGLLIPDFQLKTEQSRAALKEWI